MFNPGDVVIKYKQYTPETYCAFGGDANSVPINSEGRVLQTAFSTEYKIPYVKVRFDNGNEWNLHESELKLKKEKQMLDSMKKFYEKHQDVFFTIGLVLLVDYFLFNGAMRSQVQSLFEKLLKSIESKLEGKKEL